MTGEIPARRFVMGIGNMLPEPGFFRLCGTAMLLWPESDRSPTALVSLQGVKGPIGCFSTTLLGAPHELMDVIAGGGYVASFRYGFVTVCSTRRAASLLTHA